MDPSARPLLSHAGIFVTDLPRMEEFYTNVFGLLVTDRGRGTTFKNDLVFLSGSADQHHQLVLSSGREPGTKSTIMQLSFKVASLQALRESQQVALGKGATELLARNHGNAWSIYFYDPEENRIEMYLDTPFHTAQPCADPLDLNETDEEILRQTAALIGVRGGMTREDYVSEMESLLR